SRHSDPPTKARFHDRRERFHRGRGVSGKRRASDAFKVSHGDLNAFGFRVDYQGHAVLLSGDTRPSENLVLHARGVDVMIHEVGMFAPTSETGRQTVALLHSTPEQAGEEFSQVAPKLAVYSH